MSIKTEIKSLKKRIEKLNSPGEDIVLLTPEEIEASKKEQCSQTTKTFG